jgi:hypothetical protein
MTESLFNQMYSGAFVTASVSKAEHDFVSKTDGKPVRGSSFTLVSMQVRTPPTPTAE